MGKNTFVLSILLVVLLGACTSQAPSPPPPTATQMPEPTPSPTPTAVPTLASLPDGSTVYGDPGGRFSLPLVGDWTPVETDGSYGHFRLAEPILDAYVVTVESEDLDAVAEAALTQIGLDPAALSQPYIVDLSRWTAYMYALDSGRGVTLVAQRLGGAAIAVIFSGESSVTTAPPAEVFLPTLDGLALMPLADYLEFQPPPAPSTVEDIENLNTIEFYSGRTKLVGRLTLPEGEGPFPAIVYTGWGSGKTTRRQFSPNYMRRAGLAVFSYDKRGAGDSEGVFVEAGLYTGEWRLPQLADDALAAVAFLQGLEEINPDQIGLMGESQNGWTIPLAAAKSDAVAFTVIIAGPTVSIGEELYWSQIAGDADRISKSKREELSEQMAAYDGPRGFDPRQSIEAMSIPGLWIWGDRDGSIPVRKCKAILESIIEEYDKDFSTLYDP